MTIRHRCVKSQMFETPFFSGAMTFHAVDRQVIPPYDQRWNDIFAEGEEAQRELSKGRVKDSMVPYLLNNRNNAFFSALTLIMVPYDGSDAIEGQHFKFVPQQGSEEVGDLDIGDDVMLFIADGQHRREAIALALREDKTIGKQHVPVIFVPFKGTGRTRQLFTDLNLNAKPVNRTLALALETRDPVVIATKRVTLDFELFRGPPSRVNFESNSLAARSNFVVSMNTLVAAHSELLAAFYQTNKKDLAEVAELQEIKDRGPDDDNVRAVAARLIEVWQIALDNVPDLSKVMREQLHPGKLREGTDPQNNPWGGYVYAFGIGWQAIALAAAKLIALLGPNWQETLAQCIGSVDWRKGQHWNGIAMVGTRVNNTGPGIRATAGYLLEKGGVRDLLKGDLAALAESSGRSLEQMQAVSEEIQTLFKQLDKSRAAAVPVDEESADPVKVAAE